MTAQEGARAIAAALGVDWKWVYALVQFESGWKPDARNAISGARGLIQFMPATAHAMGFAGSATKGPAPTAADTLVGTAPTIEQQVPLVVRYLRPYGPFPTAQSLFMAVFYPVARAWDSARAFPAEVRAANPGIKTVSDYVSKVWKRMPATPLPLILAIGAIALIGALYLRGQHGA